MADQNLDDVPSTSSSNVVVVVIGIGAMGGNMARALLDSATTQTVVGYDTNTDAVQTFYEEAKSVQKHGGNGIITTTPTFALKEAVFSITSSSSSSSSSAPFVILSLVNESQCELVCFGEEPDNLYNLLHNGSCVILTSTVSPTWSKAASEKFLRKGIFFVDCPVSGGPARARLGDLTMMASGDPQSLQRSRPILEALGKQGDVHIIEGGAGAGSTAKCVHQLLAGVHICVAAEAMAMAAKAGLNVDQLYQVVNGAAGASWMFTDRGKRMLAYNPEVKSALNIFVKDLGIVWEESKRLQSPIPVASAALQQFISGQSLGLGQRDDSQVVKVYETITQVPVCGEPSIDTKDKVDIRCHSKLVLANEFVQVYRSMTNKNSTIVDEQEVVIDGNDKLTIYSSDAGSTTIHLLQSTPSLTGTGNFSFDEFVFQADISTNRFQVYKQKLEPGETLSFNFPFFHLTLANCSGCVEQRLENGLCWLRKVSLGDVEFKEPTGMIHLVNGGNQSVEWYYIRLS